ncbi:MAG: 23S rRNA (guanosine(2251)-2'-O)-methyltransferase RlmB [Lachnospirales bacterium]
MENNKNFKEIINEGLQLEGRNAVLEALNSDRQIDKIWFKKGEIEGTLKLIKAKAKEKNIVVQEINKYKLDEISNSHNHQGVIAICPVKEYVEVDEILELAKVRNEDPFIIILDGITDTHNLGAIIRSANAAGAHGIIIPKRRAATLSGIISKTSAGAVNYMLVSRVTNIGNTIDELKRKGIWVHCGTMDGIPYFKSDLTGPVALVIGDEGNGISKLVEKKCDTKISIPMYGEVASLNASCASSLLLYEVVRQRNFK